MLKWSLIFLALVLSLIAFASIVGLGLPKGHIACCRARFRRPAAAVWETITDFAAQPTWRSDLARVERADDRNGHPVWIEIGRNGRLPLEVEVFDPPRRMVTRIVDPKLPFGGTWTYDITETSDGATLTITEHGEVYNPIFRFMARHVFGYHGTLKRYLTALGAQFDENVNAEIVT